MKKSIKMSKEIVRIREVILTENDPEQLESQHELAHALLADSQTKQAITFFKHIVKVHDNMAMLAHYSLTAGQSGLLHSSRMSSKSIKQHLMKAILISLRHSMSSLAHYSPMAR
jgi:metal-dependent HD superfamily phosphatase/phosphodiesterase